jgi:hypothetical protein
MTQVHGLPHAAADCATCAELAAYLEERQTRLDELEEQLAEQPLRRLVEGGPIDYTVARPAIQVAEETELERMAARG